MVAFFPCFNGLRYEGLKMFLNIARFQIDDFEGDLQDFMDLRIKTVGFGIEKNAEHSTTCM